MTPEEVRLKLSSFDRLKLLEVIFNRMQNSVPEVMSDDEATLYAWPLEELKDYVSTQHPQDPILLKILKMMS